MATGEGSDSPFICIATFIPVRHWWDVIPLLRAAARIHKQIDAAPGNITWNTRGNPLRKQFWTYSVWRDRASVDAFVRAMPHAAVIPRTAAWSGSGAAFAEWTSASGQLDWDEALRRLETPSFYHTPRS